MIIDQIIQPEASQLRVPDTLVDRAVQGFDAFEDPASKLPILSGEGRSKGRGPVPGKFGRFAIGVAETLVLPHECLDARLATAGRQEPADEADQLRLDPQGE